MFDDAVVEEGMDTQELLVELARLRASHKVIASEFRAVAALARSSHATWAKKWGSARWRVRWESGSLQDFSTSATLPAGFGKVGSDRKDSIGVTTPLPVCLPLVQISGP